jgi:RNA polymerase subunit RPABC4/transcription elongation factor Spt4
MVRKVFKIAELDGKKPADKEELPPNLRGKIIILNPELSEIAQHLGIKEKGVFAVKSV